MRIKRLELKNFRGFEELTINFPEDSNVAVFVGVNGAGKTSVLEGCSNILSILPNRPAGVSLPFKDKGNLEISDIKNGAEETTVQVIISALTFEIKEIISLDNNGSPYVSDQDINLNDVIHKKIVLYKYLNQNDISIPILVYFPTDRVILGKPKLDLINISNIKKKDTYKFSFPKATAFDEFFNWFRSFEDYENEQRLYKNPDFRDKGLEAVRKAISIFLPSFSNPRVQRQPQEELIVEKNGEKLSISNLSHGERLMFAMVGDIARRLSIANPGLDDPLQGEGVVLIDEIELHLHPGWQRKIVPLLTKTFPNIQFILTTHSPQVISSVERESVFILEDFKLVEKTPHTFGRDSNSILQDLFNVTERPDEVKKEFRKLYRLMDKPEETETTKHLLKEMEEKYGADDPEIMRAKMHLEFLNEE